MPNGGWIKKWRKELTSDIWMMPPLYHRTWDWLLQNVGPTTGSMRTSIGLIADGVAWFERGLLRVPNKRTIMKILDWLEAHEMLSRESNASGTTVTVVNWTAYQSTDVAKVTPDAQANAHCTTRSTTDVPQDQDLNQLLQQVEEGNPQSAVQFFLPICGQLKMTEGSISWLLRNCTRYGHRFCCEILYEGTLNGSADKAKDPERYWHTVFEEKSKQKDHPEPMANAAAYIPWEPKDG